MRRHHLLFIGGMQDEGYPEMGIECPNPGSCKHTIQSGPYQGMCLPQMELSESGTDIIRGYASGPGPWIVTLDYTGRGEEAEGWLTLHEPEEYVVHVLPRGRSVVFL